MLTLFSSYQEYMIITTRNKGNWEAKFSNITYEQAQEIAKDDNVKEICISHKIGMTEGLSKNGVIKFDIRAYDENSLKNANIHITEGRLPENSNEVIVSLTASINTNLIEKIYLGSEVEVSVNGEVKKYIVVRKNK